MRRFLHSGWILLVALLALSLAGFYWVGWTESGLQSLSTHLSRPIGPVTLSIKGVRGTLARGAHIDSFTLDHQRTHIEASDINGRVQMFALFWMSIRVEEARIGSALVHVLPRVDDHTIWTPHFLRAPMSVDVSGVNIAEGTLVATNGHQWTVADLSASGIVHAYSIRIYSGAFRYAGSDVQTDGEVLAALPIGLRGKLRLNIHQAGQPAWTANAAFDGNLDKLPISGEFTEPFMASFNGNALQLSQQWHWQAAAQVKRFDLRTWGGGNALGVITGALGLYGDRNAFHARGELTPPGLLAGPLQVEFDGNYADHVVTAERIHLAHRPSGTTLNAAGTIGIVAGGPRLDLKGGWQSLRWPLADTAAAVHSASGNYTLSGVRPFALHAGGELQVKDLPAMKFDAEAILARDRLDITSARLDAFDGVAALSGYAAWSPEQRWQVGGTMRNFNVEKARPGIRGRLNFQLLASGEGFYKGGTLRSQFDNLSGDIRGQRASGKAQVELAGEDWSLKDVRLQLGGTRIIADGRVGSRIDLQFDIDADNLGLLKPDASGRLRARGKVRGDARQPSLQLDASGSDIVWGDATLQSLNARVSLEPQGSGRADVELQISHLKYDKREAESVHLHSSGTVAAHNVTLDIKAPQLQLHAAGDASLNDGLWRWQVAQLRAEDGRDLLLNLEAPAVLELAADRLKIGRLCLHGSEARLCGSGSSVTGARTLEVAAENLPLRALTAGVAATTDFDGTLSVEAHGDAPSGAPWRGKLSARLVNAAVRHHFTNGRVESFDLGTGNVGLELGDSDLVATVELDAGQSGHVNGKATARGTDADWHQWPLSGQLNLQSNALSLIDSYITGIDRASGRIDADLTLAGTAGALQFGGTLKVSDARVDAYQINLALRDVTLDARLNDSVLTLSGSASAGVDGKARFNGDLRWRAGQPYGQLHLEGDNLLIVNIPEAKVYAAPNVDMKIAGRRIDIGGSVELPYARLEQPEQLASAVRTSSDEVIVNNSVAAASDPFHVFINVALKLGDRVTINTSGLQGRLSGALTTITDESGFSRGSGELNVEEGKYTAYGRKLDITRGRLIFSNSPLGDPGVDLRATKRFPDVIAGVNVRGTLSSPRMTFFSEPEITQSQIVSLLLAGGSLERVQSSNDMVLQGSALIAQQFGNRIGADVSVESNLQNDTSLVLGRYLSPRLYLSYGISIAEAINTIKLNYTIGDKWTIRTEAGRNRSADLVYTLQR